MATATRPARPRGIPVRLSTMMFFQFFGLGAVIPVLSLYLTGSLHFSGFRAGWILSMPAIAAFVSPLVVSVAADRWIVAERLYGLLHLGAACFMGFLAVQQDFFSFLLGYLGFSLFFGPTSALANAITFHHSPGSRRRFGNIRVWGTLGWIAVAWAFGFFWLHGHPDRLVDALWVSSATSLFLGVYAFSLPSERAPRFGGGRVLPVEALRVYRFTPVLVLSATSMMVALVDRYYYFGTAPFLRAVGFEEGLILPAMSLGQVSEIAAMAVLAGLIQHLGLQRVLAAGILAEVVRFAALFIGRPVFVILTGLFFHGIAYGCFFTAAYIALDGHCDTKSRSGVHLLFAVVTSGIGNLTGSLFGRQDDGLRHGIR